MALMAFVHLTRVFSSLSCRQGVVGANQAVRYMELLAVLAKGQAVKLLEACVEPPTE